LKVMVQRILYGLLGTSLVAALTFSACSGTIQVNERFASQPIARSDAASPEDEAATPDGKKLAVPAAGDVLIAGGIHAKKSTTAAQFYNPTTKKFTNTGSLGTSLASPCSLALPTIGANSPIFVAGGGTLSATTRHQVTVTLTPLNSVEEYSPGTALFSTLSNTMTMPRMGCTATWLTTGPEAGDVLIAGGLNSSGQTAKYCRDIRSYRRDFHSHDWKYEQRARLPYRDAADDRPRSGRHSDHGRP
jgi:hypothetical protein